MDNEVIINNMKAVLKSTRKKKSTQRKKRRKSEDDNNKSNQSDELISELMNKNWKMKSPPAEQYGKKQKQKEIEGSSSVPKINAFERMMMSRKNDCSSPCTTTQNQNLISPEVSNNNKGHPNKKKKGQNGKRGRKKKSESIEKVDTESDLSILDEESLLEASRKVATLAKSKQSPTQQNGISKFFQPQSLVNNKVNINHSLNGSSNDVVDDDGKTRKRSRGIDNSNQIVDCVTKKRRTKDSKMLLDSNENENEIENSLVEEAVEEERYQSGRPKRSCSNRIDYSLLLNSPEKTTPERKVRNKNDSLETIEINENSPNRHCIPKTSFNQKLAPVFIKKIPKPIIDQKTMEARRNFLLSELPSNLRVTIDKQKQYEDEILSNELIAFPLISHITQLKKENYDNLEDIEHKLCNQSRIKIKASENNEWKLEHLQRPLKCGAFTNCRKEDYNIHVINDNDSVIINGKKRDLVEDLKAAVRKIKDESKNFPVNRCFKQLLWKLKCAKNNHLETESGINDQNSLFVDIFKPTHIEEFLIGIKPIMSLQEFFTSWNEKSSKYDEYDSDSNSRQLSRGFNNFVVLSGRNGCGKTLSVYALANELNYEVIEINAGARRSGKKILQDLQEATQSHRVEKNLLDDESNSASNLNDMTIDKKTIILIEDAELTFDNDDGFIASIQQLINISKRPVILTTNDRNCQHLQKFIHYNEILYENPTSFVTKYLSLLCLATSNYHINDIEIENLYAHNGHDLRKTINEIEFFIRSDSAKINNSSLTELFQCTKQTKSNQKRQLILNGRKDLLPRCSQSTIISDCFTLLSCTQRVTESDEISYHQRNIMNEMANYFELCNVVQMNFEHDFAYSQHRVVSSSISNELCNTISSSRAKALDYSPILRDICRSEKNRENRRRTTSRNHYLKLQLPCNSFTNDYFNAQCKIFQDDEEEE